MSLTMVATGRETVAHRMESYRGGLVAYCTRLLGSPSEAEDAVQETLLRAWRGFGRFEGRASLGTWLYSVATNVCWDMQRAPQRRPQPLDMRVRAWAGSPPSRLRDGFRVGETSPASPMPPPGGDDPADLATNRDALRRAVAVALQRLPPRQRAVLVLRDALRWHAGEVAELLGTSVPSVHSALQRARRTLAASGAAAACRPGEPANQAERAVVSRYVEAFERADLDALVSLVVTGAAEEGGTL